MNEASECDDLGRFGSLRLFKGRKGKGGDEMR